MLWRLATPRAPQRVAVKHLTLGHARYRSRLGERIDTAGEGMRTAMKCNVGSNAARSPLSWVWPLAIAVVVCVMPLRVVTAADIGDVFEDAELRSSAQSFAERLRLVCPACGGDIRLIAFITDPGPIRKILAHIGEPVEPPPVSPACGPPTEWPELVQAHDDRDVMQAAPDELPVIDIHSL